MVQTRASNKDKRVGLPDLATRSHDKATTGKKDRHPGLSIEDRQEVIKDIARLEHDLLTNQAKVAANSRDPPGPSMTKQPRPTATAATAASKVNTTTGMW
jgi:hypothetical protein